MVFLRRIGELTRPLLRPLLSELSDQEVINLHPTFVGALHDVLLDTDCQ